MHPQNEYSFAQPAKSPTGVTKEDEVILQHVLCRQLLVRHYVQLISFMLSLPALLEFTKLLLRPLLSSKIPCTAGA